MSNIKAMWSVELWSECPGCNEPVDLLGDPDFWDGVSFQPCENKTARTKDVTVYCPRCGHEFDVDLEY